MTSIERTTAGRAVIVGSGLAGLSAALELGDCTVVTKTALGDGASRHAQGGIAAAIAGDDTPAAHASDTVAVGGGLSDTAIADLVCLAAGERVEWLRELGTRFDVDEGGALALGREAGHGRRRIVHADGDATGAEVMRALRDAVRRRPDIEVVEHTHAIDLVIAGDRAVGVLTADASGRRAALLAPAVVLATGGIGRLYACTTNPSEATGDGLAMAIRAGVPIRDPEFVQFHPTALASSLDPLPLLTEALRGEGAHLVDATGHRYLLDVHPAAELAPRDVVARANWHEQQRGPIYLDARIIGAEFPERFPTVFAFATRAGLDPRSEPLPVSPAQHYHMGGVATDHDGRTDLPGLFACGEVASTGLHGANRLASNSLVEGLVIGARVARAIGRVAATPRIGADGLRVPDGGIEVATLDDTDAIADLRALLWERGGLVRHDAGLRDGLARLAVLVPRLHGGVTGRNLAEVAHTVLGAALQRRESRGSHHRTDHPDPAPGNAHHTVVRPRPAPLRTLAPAAQPAGTR